MTKNNANPRATVEYGLTRFAHMTFQEFKSTVLGVARH